MVISMKGKNFGRFELAWKLFDAALTMLVFGTVNIEIRDASETPNVGGKGRGAGSPAERPA